jgi:hypothetical protein
MPAVVLGNDAGAPEPWAVGTEAKAASELRVTVVAIKLSDRQWKCRATEQVTSQLYVCLF